MAQQSRATIKTYFETGDIPTQGQFENSFDSEVFWVDDVETDLSSNSDLKLPTVKAVVDGMSSYETITKTNWDILVTANGLVLGRWYKITTAYTNTAFGDMDCIVFATSENTIELDLIWTKDQVGSLSGYVPMKTIGITLADNTIVGGNIKLTSAQALALTSGFLAGMSVYVEFGGDQYWANITNDGSGVTTGCSKITGSGNPLNFGQLSNTYDSFTATTVASGDVVGPASSTNNNVALFDGATGKLLKDSGLGLSGTNTGDNATNSQYSGLAASKLDLVRTSNLIDIATDGAATSGTTSTYSTGGLITPTQILAGDALEVYCIARKSATNGTITIRLYANTVNSLSGSPILIGASAAITAATRQTYFTRWLRIKVANGTGAGTEVQNTSTTTQADATNATTAVSTLAINWTVNQFLIVAIQNSNGTDSSVSTMFKVRR